MFKKKVVQEDNQQNVPIELQTQNVIPSTSRVTTNTQIVISQSQQNTPVETETLREVVIQEAASEVTRATIQQVVIPT